MALEFVGTVKVGLQTVRNATTEVSKSLYGGCRCLKMIRYRVFASCWNVLRACRAHFSGNARQIRNLSDNKQQIHT